MRGDNRYDRAARFGDSLIYEVCRLFFYEKMGATAIAEKVNESGDFSEKINRETVYPILLAGHARGLFDLYAPLRRDLATWVTEEFGIQAGKFDDVAKIQVVNQFGDRVAEEIFRRAAKTAHELIQRIARRKGKGKRVHLGFASGWSSREVARALAEKIRHDPSGIPALTLHAISSGFDERDTNNASITFFNYFERLPVDVESYGLFAPPFVRFEDYEFARNRPGARLAFEHRDEIDLIVTSLARADDKHGEMWKFIRFLSNEDIDVDSGAGKRSGRADATRGGAVRSDTAEAAGSGSEFPSAREFVAQLKAARWIGDVMYRAFSDQRAIQGEVSHMPLTLFSIRRLVARAKEPNKALLLVAGPCSGKNCGMTRAEALLPLMRNPDLKVWTHIVMDAATAARLKELVSERAEVA